MMDPLADAQRRIEALGIGQPDPARAPAFDEDCRRVVEDRSSPSADRRTAFGELSERWAAEPALADVVLALIDDPDLDLARDAIASAPPFDARVIARLRELLDDPRPEIWAAAALAVARKKDHSILPLVTEWVRGIDRERRRVGLLAVAFLLTPEPHLAFIESVCEDGPRDDQDEGLLVESLRVAEARVAFWRAATGELP